MLDLYLLGRRKFNEKIKEFLSLTEIAKTTNN